MAKFYIDGSSAEFSSDDLAKLRVAADLLHLSPAQMADWVERAASTTATPGVPLSSGEHAFFAASSGLAVDADVAHVETAAQQQARLLRNSLTTKEAAERLGVGPDAIRHRLGKKQLWSFLIAGQHRIPIWQFESTEPAENTWSAFRRQAPPLPGRGGGPDWLFDLLPLSMSAPNMQSVQEQFDGLGEGGPFWLRVSVRDAEGNVLRELDDAPLAAALWTTLPGLEKVVPAVPGGTTPAALEGFMTTPQDELLVGGRPWAPRRWLSEGQAPEAVASLVADLGTVW